MVDSVKNTKTATTPAVTKTVADSTKKVSNQNSVFEAQEVNKMKDGIERLKPKQAQMNFNYDMENGKLEYIPEKKGLLGTKNEQYIYHVNEGGERCSSALHRYNISDAEQNFFKDQPEDSKILYGGELIINRTDLLENYKKEYDNRPKKDTEN